jgi:hypothetical protein
MDDIYKVWVQVQRINDDKKIYENTRMPDEAGEFTNIEEAEDFADSVLQASTVLHAVKSRTEERIIGKIEKVGDVVHTFLKKHVDNGTLRSFVEGKCEKEKCTCANKETTPA